MEVLLGMGDKGGFYKETIRSRLLGKNLVKTCLEVSCSKPRARGPVTSVTRFTLQSKKLKITTCTGISR